MGSEMCIRDSRRTGCHGENIFYKLKTLSDKGIKIKLHAAEDSFIPLGVAATATLPSKDSIIENSMAMINE